MVRAALLLIGGLIAASATAAESVVLGKGVSNAYAADVACTDIRACMQSVYVWEFDATRTITGPPVIGRVKVLATQHTDATSKFVRSVELFVVRPIDDPAVRKTYDAEYYLVGLSPRYERSTYCLPVNPADIGLNIPSSEINVEPDSGYYCFARRLVR